MIDRTNMATAAPNTSDCTESRQYEINKYARSQQAAHKPAVVWLTGLSGAGKTATATELERRLLARDCRTCLLDGDRLRAGLSRDLGYTDADRSENIRRVAEVARLFVDSGLIVIVALISPFRAERAFARSLVEEGEFIEVFIDTPLSVAEQRDPKGLYRKARLGQLPHFTGIDSPYESPSSPELHIETTQLSCSQGVDLIVQSMLERGILSADA